MVPDESDNVQRWRQMAANESPHVEAMHEIVLQHKDEGMQNFRWFCGSGRELFAEERDGRWVQIEYVFPADEGLFVLHWADSKPIRLWRVSAADGERRPERYQGKDGVLAFTFPARELQHLEFLMQKLPHSLWARLVKLALDAHFSPESFPQRKCEPRMERRRLPRVVNGLR